MIFGDSSGFIAAFDARDQNHAAAAEGWRQLASQGEGILTTQLVFAETVTYLRRRAGWQVSRQVGESLLSRRGVDLLAIPLHADDLGDRGILRALTFDRHFEAAGFEILH